MNLLSTMYLSKASILWLTRVCSRPRAPSFLRKPVDDRGAGIGRVAGVWFIKLRLSWTTNIDPFLFKFMHCQRVPHTWGPDTPGKTRFPTPINAFVNVYRHPLPGPGKTDVHPSSKRLTKRR